MTSSSSPVAELALASLFTDNMVLQQDIPVPVWGTAPAGSEVHVRFLDQHVSGQADKDGRFMVRLAPLAPSFEPAQLVLSGDQGEVRLGNVLVGEVWVCSGQSNMEWNLSMCQNAEDEIAAATHPALRLFKVPRIATGEPQEQIPDTSWQVCSPATASGFSGVGYFFGRHLLHTLDRPVGLIGASWGGTAAEAWTSREGLLQNEKLSHLRTDFEARLPNLEKELESWQQEIGPLQARIADDCLLENSGFLRGWAGLDAPEDGEWRTMELPGNWQSHGLDFSGVLWFRREVEVPESWAGQDLQLGLGATDKSDVTYFNGTFVGSLTMKERADAWSLPREYTIPASLVRPGRNVIAVRVHSDMFQGGLIGPRSAMQLAPKEDETARPISLVGAWQYAVEANYGQVQLPPEPMGPTNPNAPSSLYNGMIHPLLPAAIRGVIWYQGESNAARHREYRDLFPNLIKDWRSRFSNPEHAFHFVQLANYRGTMEDPGDSEWARLREAQTMTLALPGTGMAVAIDIGDAQDIHPRNKQDVGLRLAYNALHHTYGQADVVPCGPLFREMTREADSLRLHFAYGEGLHAAGEELQGFAVAGEDGRFVWATAALDGDTVIVSSPQVPNPVAVRYNWADNPTGNLFNGAGLPACPFRTDQD